MQTERQKLYQKTYRTKNKSKRNAQSREWNKENPEKHKKSKDTWYVKNKDLKSKRHRAKFLVRKYGISEETYNSMFVEQNGVCAICMESQKNGKSLHIDHNHKTGKVRGLLCGNCNLGIGNLKENIEVFLKAIQYLNKNI